MLYEVITPGIIFKGGNVDDKDVNLAMGQRLQTGCGILIEVQRQGRIILLEVVGNHKIAYSAKLLVVDMFESFEKLNIVTGNQNRIV